MAPHPSTLAWKIPWTEEPGRIQSMGPQSQTRLSDFTYYIAQGNLLNAPWRPKWEGNLKKEGIYVCITD